MVMIKVKKKIKDHLNNINLKKIQTYNLISNIQKNIKFDDYYANIYNNSINTLQFKTSFNDDCYNIIRINVINSLKFKKLLYEYEKYFTGININNISYCDFIHFIKHKTAIPYWNETHKIMSDKIFLPIPKNYKNTKLPLCLKNSWFESNIVTSIQQNTTEIVIPNKIREYKSQIKATRIKLYLNKEQKECLKYLFNIYRYFYNRAIAYIKNYNKTTKTSYFNINVKDDTTKIIIDLTNETNIFSMYTMRKLLKNNKPNWINQGSISHLIDQAFKEASDKFFGCIATYKKTHKKFELHYKTYKKIQTINIEKTMIKTKNNLLNLFINFSYKSKFSEKTSHILRNIKTSENINKYNFNDSSISYNKYLKTFVLNIVYESINESYDEIQLRTDKTTQILNQNKVVSNDIGVRIFGTLYYDNKVVELCKKSNNKDPIFKCCKEIDILTSIINKKKYYKKNEKNEKKIYKNNSKRKKQLKRALHKKYKKLKDMKEELHNKSINYLLLTAGRIIIPPFKVSNMVKTLNSQVARKMYTLSYYEFKQKLINKCNEYDVELIIKDEHYTSKTCTCCGTLNNKLGGNEIFNCLNCKVSIGRDINGSRGIMLKNNEW